MSLICSSVSSIWLPQRSCSSLRMRLYLVSRPSFSQIFLIVEGLTVDPFQPQMIGYPFPSPCGMRNRQGDHLLFYFRRRLSREGSRYGRTVYKALKAIFLECSLILVKLAPGDGPASGMPQRHSSSAPPAVAMTSSPVLSLFRQSCVPPWVVFFGQKHPTRREC